MRLFKQKKITCKSCQNKFPEKKAWKINMKTADGQLVLRVCPECADVLNGIKETMDTWQNE